MTHTLNLTNARHMPRGGGVAVLKKLTDLRKKNPSVKLNNLISKLHFKATHKAM